MSVSYATHGAHYARFSEPNDGGADRLYPESSDAQKKALEIARKAAIEFEAWLTAQAPRLGEYAFDDKTETVAGYVAETLTDSIGKHYRIAMERGR